MKECELCNSPARMYCESDQASLCWECDSRVHSANFLVARHVRTLLCHSCQSSTPWKASGSKFGPTVSVCVECVNQCNPMGNDEEEEAEDSHTNEEDEDDDDEEEESDDEEDIDENEEEEDGDNQVVPWSSSTPPPPPIASSSSSEDSSTRFCFSAATRSGAGTGLSLKRTRENVDLDLASSSQDDFCCSSSWPNSAIHNSIRPSNDRKRALTTRTDSKPISVVNSIRGFERNLISGNDTSAMILEICKLSKDPTRAVDLVSTDS